MNKEIVESMFPGTTALMEHGKCPHCKQDIKQFRNRISQHEFSISGLCQECQDSVFGKD